MKSKVFQSLLQLYFYISNKLIPFKYYWSPVPMNPTQNKLSKSVVIHTKNDKMTVKRRNHGRNKVSDVALYGGTRGGDVRLLVGKLRGLLVG